MKCDNSEFVRAFPSAIHNDALRMVSVLPQASSRAEPFHICIEGKTVLIPYRIYHDPVMIDRLKLTPFQEGLLDCLLTRHHSGFVREQSLRKILSSDHDWIPAFVVQLVGEYIVEILEVIRENVHDLNPEPYRRFLINNPMFVELTRSRVESYWNCYYRSHRREDYAGFEIVRFIDQLTNKSPSICP